MIHPHPHTRQQYTSAPPRARPPRPPHPPPPSVIPAVSHRGGTCTSCLMAAPNPQAFTQTRLAAPVQSLAAYGVLASTTRCAACLVQVHTGRTRQHVHRAQVTARPPLCRARSVGVVGDALEAPTARHTLLLPHVVAVAVGRSVRIHVGRRASFSLRAVSCTCGVRRLRNVVIRRNGRNSSSLRVFAEVTVHEMTFLFNLRQLCTSLSCLRYCTIGVYYRCIIGALGPARYRTSYIYRDLRSRVYVRSSHSPHALPMKVAQNKAACVGAHSTTRLALCPAD